MVVENDLGVMGRVHFSSSHVLVLFDVGVHVYHLSVSLVSEKKTGLATAWVYLEIRTVVGCAHSCLPVVVA